MSLRKVRFIHYQTFSTQTPYRGFTVKLVPTEDSLVSVSVAMCHKVDHFCKAVARELCNYKEYKTVKVTELPLFLAQLEFKSHGMRMNQAERRLAANQWAWVWKYFL